MVFDFGKKYIAENVLEISMVVAIVAYFVFIIVMVVQILRKQSQRNKLRNLSKSIAELKQFINAIKFMRTESDVSAYAEKYGKKVADLKEGLSQLDIPFPTNTDDQVPETWITYLDMLLPLALSGNIYEARLILARIEEDYKDTLWSWLRR